MDKISLIKEKIDEADLIVIGAGSGLSEASGIHYSGNKFKIDFKDYINKYGIKDLYTAGFYPYKNKEEYWGYWSYFIKKIYYENNENNLYKSLFNLFKDKNYFIISTNVDNMFEKNGFDKERIFNVQGSYSLFQCSVPCHNKLYNNKDIVFKMVDNLDKDLKIPSSLIPKCPICHKNMEMNLRVDSTFVEDETRDKQYKKYYDLLDKYRNRKILFLEFGVGYNTPSIIKYPFMNMTYNFSDSYLIRFNLNDSYIDKKIKDKFLLVNEDLNLVIDELLRS